MLKAVRTPFSELLNYENCRLVKQSQGYTGHVSGEVANLVKRLDVQMKMIAFKPWDPDSILSSLHNFKTVCDSKRFHERAAKLLCSNIS